MAKPTLQSVAFLRGINVGRAKRVAMKDLRDLFQQLGCADVQTVLNSGNVLFTPPSAGLSADEVEKAMEQRLGFSARTVMVPGEHLAKIVKQNPLEGAASEPSRLLVVFLTSPTARRALQTLTKQDWTPGAMAVRQHAGYLWLPDGVAASELMAAVARATGDGITSRNWSTVLRILALIGAMPQEAK